MSPRDARNFIRLHDGMPDHPKIEGLSDPAFRLLITTWCWCGKNLTDGFVTDASWRKRGTPKSRRELIESGLAHEVDGGVQMHDYTEHQRSKAEVEAMKAKNATNGAKGGRPRKASNPDGTEAKPSGLPVGSGSVSWSTNQEVEVEEELDDKTTSLALVCRLTSADPRTPTTTDEDVARWQEIAGSHIDLEREARRWLDANQTGEHLRNPLLAWTAWLAKAAQHTPPPAPTVGCSECVKGWRGEDPETGSPVRCTSCRPLRSVEAS